MPNSKNEPPENAGRWGVLLPTRIDSKRGWPEGRKPAITPSVLEKLREAFLIGCDDIEAALFAGISVATLYNHQKANPTFLEWKEALKRNPFLKARKTIVEHLERDPEFAMRYMERKKKNEFAPNAKLTIEDNRPTLDDEAIAKGDEILATHFAKLAERHNANRSADTTTPAV